MRAYPTGFTLLETVLYIGLIAIVLPTFILFLLQVSKGNELQDARIRLEQSAALIFSDLESRLTSASEITTSTSTLGANPSTLKFKDSSGVVITIDRPTTTVDFSGTSQTVQRLRIQAGAGTPYYITDKDIEVSEWQVNALRDTEDTLTGLRISLTLTMVNAGGTYRNATFTSDTTITLQPQTLEQ